MWYADVVLLTNPGQNEKTMTPCNIIHFHAESWDGRMLGCQNIHPAAEMTPRERLFAALRGEPTDHVPVWLLFPHHAMPGTYVDVRNHPRYAPVAKLAERQAITLDRRGLHIPWWRDDVAHACETIEDAGGVVTRRTWTWKGLSLHSETGVRGGVHVNKKMLDTQEDFEILCEMPVETDARRIAAKLDALLPKYLQEKAEFPVELGSMMLDLGEPVNMLYHASNLEEMAVASFYEETNAKLVGLLDRLMEQKRIVYQYTLDRKLADVYFTVGSELAAPPMVSLDTFRKWIVPYATALNRQIHDNGAYVIQHFHGFIKHLLPDFATMGADAIHTIEAPPVGNCTMDEAYAALGGATTLIGNIQYDDFRHLSADAMRQAVLDLLDEVAGRRFILSPSAGPYDPDVSDRFLDNYVVMMDTAWNAKARA